jgi:excinuclease ABC subunit C
MIENKLKNIPKNPGVYIFSDKSEKILYVGKAKILRNRIKSYFQKSNNPDPRIQTMVNKIADFEFIITDSDIEALILEANLIKKHKPRYNINLKDDKSYPYIRITAEDFPQVFTTRKVIRDGSAYFGPYTNVKDMRNALNTIKKIFTIRSCKYDLSPDVINKKKVSLCLDYFIKKCKGPCQGLQQKDDYDLMIGNVKKFLRGNTSEIIKDLKSEMYTKSGSQDFEDAAVIRNKIEILEKYSNTQKVVTNDFSARDIIAIVSEDDDACAVIFKIREGKIIGRIHLYSKGVLNKNQDEVIETFVKQYYNNSDEIPSEIFLQSEIEENQIIENWLSQRIDGRVKIVVPKQGEKKKQIDMCLKNAKYLLEELKLQRMKSKEQTPYVVRALQRDLKLKNIPKKIECFDISNTQGTDPVASMVCFVNGKPKKSEYRKFKIQSKQSPDDFAMMREVVKRRYSRLLKEDKPFPELIVVDGGKGQLSSALSVLLELKIKNQEIIGLAKRLEEIFLPGFSDAQMLPKTSSSLKLLQQIRDEAHRFAITFHRQRRSKRTLHSELDNIVGVGPNRRDLLLKTFGSVKIIKSLNTQQIIEKAGIPKDVAIKIYEYFNK